MCVLKKKLKWEKERKKKQTSSSGAIFFKAITCIRGSLSFLDSPPARGKTTTAFGSHEWLIKATTGETHAPIGIKAGVDIVNVLVVNLYIKKSYFKVKRMGKMNSRRTRDTRSTRSAALNMPYSASSCGEVSPRKRTIAWAKCVCTCES